jgi:hypothetical protein
MSCPFRTVSILSVIFLNVVGCATDVTYSNKYGFGPLAGHNFILQEDCMLMRDDAPSDFALYGGNVWDDSVDPVPQSIREYDLRFKQKNYSRLPAGTIVRFDKLIYDPWDMSDQFRSYGKLMSGPLAGKSVCLFSFVEDRWVGDRLEVHLNTDDFKKID